jgi:hypothetical protein
MCKSEDAQKLEDRNLGKAEDATRVETIKFAREQLSKEIQYRRDRQSQIFSWTSSVLIAVIGANIALSGTPYAIHSDYKGSLVSGIAILTLWACTWIGMHSAKERQRGVEANKLDCSLSLFTDHPLYLKKCSPLSALLRGEIISLIFIGGVAVLTIILVKK